MVGSWMVGLPRASHGAGRAAACRASGTRRRGGGRAATPHTERAALSRALRHWTRQNEARQSLAGSRERRCVLLVAARHRIPALSFQGLCAGAQAQRVHAGGHGLAARPVHFRRGGAWGVLACESTKSGAPSSSVPAPVELEVPRLLGAFLPFPPFFTSRTTLISPHLTTRGKETYCRVCSYFRQMCRAA